ncbi:MAG: cysteine methyltransferase [Chloroflexi bacterium RBG_16_54_18]|nr:MAG: cysteine methyltransferase [Chloroflexi bacterium RBG_16_54_18]
MVGITYTIMTSPLGRILVARNAEGLTCINFQDGTEAVSPQAGWRERASDLADATAQLEAYFRGELQQFEIPLAPYGTTFQRQVWQTMRAIPYGQTLTYAELARRVGRPQAARAVGGASSCNPLPVVVPCHRVVGSDGSLTGYAGGLHLKQALLDLERGKQP